MYDGNLVHSCGSRCWPLLCISQISQDLWKKPSDVLKLIKEVGKPKDPWSFNEERKRKISLAFRLFGSSPRRCWDRNVPVNFLGRSCLQAASYYSQYKTIYVWQLKNLKNVLCSTKLVWVLQRKTDGANWYDCDKTWLQQLYVDYIHVHEGRA